MPKQSKEYIEWLQGAFDWEEGSPHGHYSKGHLSWMVYDPDSIYKEVISKYKQTHSDDMESHIQDLKQKDAERSHYTRMVCRYERQKENILQDLKEAIKYVERHAEATGERLLAGEVQGLEKALSIFEERYASIRSSKEDQGG